VVAHFSCPSTVEILVSCAQIHETWLVGLATILGGMIKYYVGFITDRVVAPGKGKIATVLLELLKSGINDALIDGGLKYLSDGKWRFRVVMRPGPVKVTAECEPDPATGTRKWKLMLEGNEKEKELWPVPWATTVRPRVALEGHGLTPEAVAAEGLFQRHDFAVSEPPADYAHGVPTVN
jgi:hypothetical protein